MKDKEGERILSQINPDVHVIVWTLDGKLWSSGDLASELGRLGTYGSGDVVFVIGGSHRLRDEVLKRAQQKLFFGRMTLRYQLMRLVLVEQVYRAGALS